MERYVTEWQQPEKVVTAIAESKLTHTGKGKVTIHNVVVGNITPQSDVTEVFARTKFCPSATQVMRTISHGDGKPISPDLELVIVGLEKVRRRKLPKTPGYYDIEGIVVTANGRCEVRCSKKTRFVPSETSDKTEAVLTGT